MKVQPDLIAQKVAERIRGQAEDHQLVVETDKDKISEDIRAHKSPKLDTRTHSQGSEMIIRDQQACDPKEWTRFGPLTVRSTTGAYGAVFRPPWWLAGLLYAWELHFANSYGDWKTLLRTYSIRPMQSKIFIAAFRGDVGALRKAFALGEASPYDRAEHTGMTMFHVRDHLTFMHKCRRNWIRLIIAIVCICEQRNSPIPDPKCKFI